MKILKSILNYIPLATFIIFVVTDGIFSLTSALIFVISTIGLLINWKRKKTEMKNWENFSWYFTYFRKFNNCYSWLSNSSQTLENTKFVASELSLTLSLVLHSPIGFYEP